MRNTHPADAAMSKNLSFSQECHPGLKRTENQDSIANAATPRGELFVLSDGVGGYHGGAEASAIVTSGFPRHLRALPSNWTNEAALAEAGRRVNAEVFAAGQSGDVSRRRMSATVVLALIFDDGGGTQALIANAGDSRAYFIRDGQLTKLSTDHTAVQSMVDAGVLTPEQAQDHPHASVLTRSVGQAPEVELDQRRIALEAGDQLLLCSDGLHGFVPAGEMLAVLTSPQLSLTARTRALLDLALAAGGPDNISMQLIEVGTSNLGAAAPPPQRSRGIGKIPLAAGAGALILLGSLAGVAFYQAQQASPVALAPAASAHPNVSGIPPTTQSGTPTSVPAPPEHTARNHAVTAELMLSAEPARSQFVHFRERWRFIALVDPQHEAACQVFTGDSPIAYFRDQAVLNQAPANDPEMQSYFVAFLPYTAGVEAACGRFDLLLLPPRPVDTADRIRQAAGTLKHDAQAIKRRAGEAMAKPPQ